MQPSAFERDEPRLIERPQGAAAALLRDATQAGSQPAGPSHSHGSASSSALGASAGAQMYLCGGACGSMLEMTAFSKSRNSYLCTYHPGTMCVDTGRSRNSEAARQARREPW